MPGPASGSGTIIGQAVAAALGAAIFAVGTAAVSAISNGWLINLLGGVTHKELTKELTKAVAIELTAQIKPVNVTNGPVKWHPEKGSVAPGSDTTYVASCQPGETIIGGYCELETGYGYLFNAGLTSNQTYQCSWGKAKEGSFAALITAACTSP